MTTFVISANVTGQADAEDRRAMTLILNAENERRSAAGEALLPVATGAERRTSYELMLRQRLVEVHAKYVKQAEAIADSDAAFRDVRNLWPDATPQKKAAAVAALQ
jgi:hypothetical protein